MPATLTIRDETTTGQSAGEITLEFLTERITVRELIRGRVYQEVQDYNLHTGREFKGLVQPTAAERELNGPRTRRDIDWKKQFDVALAAFEKRGFLILIDNHQAERLEEEIVITPRTEVTFLKLVPLAGG